LVFPLKPVRKTKGGLCKKCRGHFTLQLSFLEKFSSSSNFEEKRGQTGVDWWIPAPTGALALWSDGARHAAAPVLGVRAHTAAF
jgi:hypothetical protein